MNGDGASLAEIDALLAAHPAPGVDILICPPATLIERMVRRIGAGAVAVGGQTCHTATRGAHTGDISAAMLAEAGATHVILGHSERRARSRRDERGGSRPGRSGPGGGPEDQSSAWARPRPSVTPT